MLNSSPPSIDKNTDENRNSIFRAEVRCSAGLTIFLQVAHCGDGNATGECSETKQPTDTFTPVAARGCVC